MMTLLRKYLIAGLLVWLPLAATVIVVKLVIDLLDKTLLLLPLEWRPESVLGFSIPGLGVVLALSLLIFTGMLAANFFGRRLVKIWESILGRIPLVRSIYTSVKQISTTVLESDGKSFRKVVLTQYPRKEVWSLGFLTSEGLEAASAIAGEHLIAVFIPTTPNPTSGYIIMIPESDITELDMSVEDGFKFIISMGVVVPKDTVKELKNQSELAQTPDDS